MKDKKLTAIGDIDPVTVVKKLRKLCTTEILSVGAAKEEKKKEEPKKGEEKKDPKVELIEYWKAYQHQAYHPDMPPYNVTSAEEDPNACVIC
ncbi:hypothetical protein L1049_020831 [Liquidambar formosana]|uniref:Uncharacterized protein n=1 Tax=Liquidambar formosana TaxID=63359 RepID=A0AAP0SDM8_LIQFO